MLKKVTSIAALPTLDCIEPNKIVISDELGGHMVCWHTTKQISFETIQQMSTDCNTKTWRPACNMANTCKSFNNRYILDLIQPDCTFDNFKSNQKNWKGILNNFQGQFRSNVVHIYNCKGDMVNNQMLQSSLAGNYEKTFLFGNDHLSAFMFIPKGEIAFTCPHTHNATEIIVSTCRLYESSLATPPF